MDIGTFLLSRGVSQWLAKNGIDNNNEQNNGSRRRFKIQEGAAEDMTLIVLFELVLILVLVALYYSLKNKEETSEKTAAHLDTDSAVTTILTYPYHKKQLLSRAESAFYNCLKAYTDSRGFTVFSKVRLEDIMEVPERMEFSERQRYRGYIRSRHVDFVVCDAYFNVVMAFELDDSSHNSANAKKVDDFKNQVFNHVGIPLYRIRVGSNYRTHLESIFSF